MNNDKDLTVLLLLKDRPMFTWRWMAYANKIRFPFKVLIADGGRDKTVPEILSSRSHFPDVDYEYIRYPYDQTYLKYYDKVDNALSRIKTPFVAQASNDDFFFVEGLRSAAAFLEAHPDFVAAGGDACDFVVDSPNQRGIRSNLYGQIAFPGKIYSSQDIIDDTAVGRLQSYIYGPLSSFLWVAVARTNILRQAYRKLLDVNPADLRFGDHLVFFLTIAAGKTHRETRPYYLHQSNTQESIGAEVTRDFPTYLHWIRRREWMKDFSNLVEAVSKTAADYDGISAEDYRENFKRLYLSLIGKNVVGMFYPQAEPAAGHNIAPRLEQSCEFKTIRDFLANGPFGLETEIWRKTQPKFYGIFTTSRHFRKSVVKTGK